MRRRRLPISIIAVVLAALTAAGGFARVAAQDATPPARPMTPAPAACTVAPHPIAFFEQFVGTPTAAQAAAQAAPIADATPAAAFRMPPGEPADQETVAAVTAIAIELTGCVNAGDFPRLFALYTDDYFRRGIEDLGPLTAEDVAFFAAPPQAKPEQNRAAILAVLDVRVLAEGRVAGLFDTYDPLEAPPGPARFYWEFVEQDGRWLIDEQVTLGRIDPAQVGTPTL
ncbi:MAG: hypothetical protein ACRDJH_00990 [Thermomicrobiales bacterium]